MWDPILKITKAKWARDMAQVAELLPELKSSAAKIKQLTQKRTKCLMI
jgi:hypothetical protein